MKKSILILILFLVTTCKVFSQEKVWQADLFTFFDNVEFGGSDVKVPQTMSGVMLAPEAGLRWDSIHKISIGINLLHEFGSRSVIGNFYPTAYYDFSKRPFRFLMGAFPRGIATDNYPRLFFQDSVYYYRPNIEGIFFEFKRDRGYVNLWLDWTGRQSVDVNEAFFTSISGRYNIGILYARHFGYMYHFASRKDPFIDEALHDNLMFHTALGIDLSGKTILDRFDINAGWVTGLERARAENTGWIAMHGMILEARIEFKGLGLFNSLYTGKGLMYYYGEHDKDLYWGDPAYRAKNYNRTDIYVNFFKERNLNLELTYSLHFLESKMYHEQMLKVKIDLNNL
ncbi:MAG: hypothetical protein A2V50_01760 [Bacteroidetes bacterium RBG_19FT_COMBO_42_10]|nr:MAG: hypothetical protein A2V50_01760 [Bacteroidetes bacterium RBG_19FT_COMBO_42_10]